MRLAAAATAAVCLCSCADGSIEEMSVPYNTTVTLDGSRFERPGARLQWRLVDAPAGSAAVMSQEGAAIGSFLADLEGEYVAMLVEGTTAAAAEIHRMKITAENRPPELLLSATGASLTYADIWITAAGTIDPNGDRVTVEWELEGAPSDAATLDPSGGSALFRGKVPGTYLVAATAIDEAGAEARDTIAVTIEEGHVRIAAGVGEAGHNDAADRLLLLEHENLVRYEPRTNTIEGRITPGGVNLIVSVDDDRAAFARLAGGPCCTYSIVSLANGIEEIGEIFIDTPQRLLFVDGYLYYDGPGELRRRSVVSDKDDLVGEGYSVNDYLLDPATRMLYGAMSYGLHRWNIGEDPPVYDGFIDGDHGRAVSVFDGGSRVLYESGEIGAIPDDVADPITIVGDLGVPVWEADHAVGGDWFVAFVGPYTERRVHIFDAITYEDLGRAPIGGAEEIAEHALLDSPGAQLTLLFSTAIANEGGAATMPLPP